MAHLVALQYNPYLPQLNILIDGRPASAYGHLIRFTDEDILLWHDQILNAIYEELRDSFELEFTGTPIDIEIMKSACSVFSPCTAFRSCSFSYEVGLQDRMGQLNQLIRKHGIRIAEKICISADFRLSPDLLRLENELKEIQVENLFCSVPVGFCRNWDPDRKDRRRFVVCSSFDEGCNILRNVPGPEPSFILRICDQERFCGLKQNTFFFDTTEEALVDTVFDCLLTEPLLTAFRRGIDLLPEALKQDRAVFRLCAVEPELSIETPTQVELGKSNPIRISQQAPGHPQPRLQFRIRDTSIATCDGCSVFGCRTGTTVLEVYRPGASFPFHTQKIEVIRRNRIQTLIMSDDEMRLGVGDSQALTCEISPEDADNVDTIQWKSSDPRVAKVSSAGYVTAVGPGCCRVICCAENISAVCICTVKPHLQEIHTDIENDKLLLRPAEKRVVHITTEPADAIDRALTLESSDYDVVNIVGNTFLAKKEGYAKVTVRNQTGRKTLNIFVTVRKEEEPKEKKPGFLKKLFHK